MRCEFNDEQSISTKLTDMPRIGNINLIYEGDGYKTHEIFYKQGQGFLIKGISKEFEGLTGFKTYGWETERALTEAVKAACRKFRELKTTSKRVILYKCAASAELRMNKVSEGSYTGNLAGVSDKIADTGFGDDLASFSMDYMLAQVVNDGTDKKYFEINSVTKEPKEWELKHRDISDYQEMDYTEEREQFFLNIVESMKKMVVSASLFFGAEPERAIKFIENKENLLALTPKSE